MKRNRDIIVFILLLLLWGSQYLGIKYSVKYFPTFFGLFTRYAFTFLLVQFFIWKNKIPTSGIVIKDHSLFVLFKFIAFILLYMAQRELSSIQAGVIFLTSPFFVLFLSPFYFKDDYFRFSSLAAIVLGFGGVLLMVPESEWERGFHFGASSLVLLGAFLNSFNRLYGKKIAYTNHALVMLRSLSLGIALPSGILSLVFERDASFSWELPGIIALVYLGTFCSFGANMCYIYLLKKIKVSIMSSSQILTLFSVLVLGVFIGKEELPVGLPLALTLITAGFGILYWKNFRKA